MTFFDFYIASIATCLIASWIGQVVAPDISTDEDIYLWVGWCGFVPIMNFIMATVVIAAVIIITIHALIIWPTKILKDKP